MDIPEKSDWAECPFCVMQCSSFFLMVPAGSIPGRKASQATIEGVIVIAAQCPKCPVLYIDVLFHLPAYLLALY